MSWFPIGPNAVFAPRNSNFTRLSRRNELGMQGLVANIAIDPTDPGTIYVAELPLTGGASAFRTRDNGDSWKSISDSLPNVTPSCVAVNPSNPATIYMGNYSGAGYRSNDYGDSWSQLSNMPDGVGKLIVDPRTAANPQTTVILGASDSGVWRSSDNGATWTNVLPGSIDSLVAYMPGLAPGLNDQYYAGVANAGVYNTSDATGAWTNLNAQGIGLPAVAAAPTFTSVLVDYCPIIPSRVYAWFATPDPLDQTVAITIGTYTTSAPSMSWTKIWPALGASQPPNPGYGFYSYVFAVAPNSPGDGMNDILFFGGIDLWRSKNAGKDWKKEGTRFHEDQHAFAFFPANPPVGDIPSIYVGCDGGIATSDKFCDPNYPFETAATDFDELDNYTDSGVYQNLNRGKQSSAIRQYNSDPLIGALGYIGCQDTGIAAGAGALGWRGIITSDFGSIAVANGLNGVTVWVEDDFQQLNIITVFTDQGELFPPSSWPTFGIRATLDVAAGPQVSSSSNYVTTSGIKCVAGIVVQGSAFVGRIDQNGIVTQISTGMGLGPIVNIVAVHPNSPDILYCGTKDQRLLYHTDGTAPTKSTIWDEATGHKPAGIQMSSIAIDSLGNAYVLLKFAVTPVGQGFTTPLFQISSTGEWVGISCSNLPAGSFPYGKLLADPEQANNALYASNGGRVYQLTLTPFPSCSWTDISDGLPEQVILDLWIGNINPGVGAPPKVLLRAAIPTRGVWERDVTAVIPGAPPTLPGTLYVRDNTLDLGWLHLSPDGVPDPYHPGDPASNLYHYLCADIKVDAQQPGTAAVPPYFQTDPESPTPITGVIFDELKDNSQIGSSQAMVHVQVHNHSNNPASNVRVWAIYCSAAAGLPALNMTASLGVYFPFWDQFTAAGQIITNLPGDSLWHSIGPPQTLSGITAASPQVASWNWAVPTPPSGDPGHYCIAAFIHSGGSPVNETISMNMDEITPKNRQVGQKNLHILSLPAIPPLKIPNTGPPAGIFPPGGGPPRPGQLEFIEFHNPILRVREASLVIDLRGLPPQLSIAFQLSHLETVNPLPRSITGVARTRKEDPADFIEDAGDSGDECRCFENLERLLAGLKKIFCKSKEHHKMPQLDPVVHEAEPSARVEIKGVRLPPYGFVTAAIQVRNTGELKPGSEFRFQVQQAVDGVVAGGSMYVVRIAGTPEPAPSPVADSVDTRKETRPEQERGGLRLKYVPPWAEQMVKDREKLLKKTSGT
jgi:hypothetical protein